MKNFTAIIVLLAILFWHGKVSAQITLEQSDHNFATTSDSVFVTFNPTISIPPEGANVSWSYADSFALGAPDLLDPDVDASQDPFFQADVYREDSLFFQDFEIPTRRYLTADNDGVFTPAIYINQRDFSIQAISGGANDSLHILEKTDVHAPGRIDLIRFPTEYQDQWTMSRTENLDFELTAAAFQLNRTPGRRQKIITHEREVVGHGQITVPLSGSRQSAPLDVLLMKVVVTEVDSYFLGGAVAPVQITTAFGVSQGDTRSTEEYIFYNKQDAGAAAFLRAEGSTVTSIAVYPRYYADANTSGLTDAASTQATSFLYPNPVQSGQALRIEGPEHQGATLRIITVAGQEVGQWRLEPAQNRVELSQNLNPGVYFYEMVSLNGQSLMQGGLTVE